MRLGNLWLAFLGLALILCLPTAPANAQATRTWVSGVGDDVNPCSRTAPCKTWAGAISKTANGGEIDALDPGGFGALTITKSITLDGGGGQVASTLVAGTNGIVVAAQPTDIVIIQNVRFQGLLGNGANAANAGLSAINFISGAGLIVEKCEIIGFNVNGISVISSTSGAFASISNTNITNVANDGIFVGGTANKATIHNVRVAKSKNGLEVGICNTATVDHSVFSHGSNSGIAIDAGGSVGADFIQASNNGSGIIASGSISIGNSDVNFNITAFQGTVTSFGNNRAVGNSGIGTTPTLGGATTDHGQL